MPTAATLPSRISTSARRSNPREGSSTVPSRMRSEDINRIVSLSGSISNRTGQSMSGMIHPMRNEFTAIIEQADGWFIAYSPEVSGANGQGRTKDEALASLRSAIELILADRREEG